MSTSVEAMSTFYTATHLIRLFRKITSNTGRIGLTRCAIFWLRYHQPVCSSSYASASKKPMHSSYALTDERGAPTVCAYGMGMFHRRAVGTASIPAPDTIATSVRFCVVGCLTSTVITDMNLRSSTLWFVGLWHMARYSQNMVCYLEEAIRSGYLLSTLPLSPARRADAEHIVCGILPERKIRWHP